MEGEWKEVVNKKKVKKEERERIKKEEIDKWDKLKSETPHIINSIQAVSIQEEENISGLAKALTSKEWIEHQRNGWKYYKTIAKEDYEEDKNLAPGEIYCVLPVKNKYSDLAIFIKV